MYSISIYNVIVALLKRWITSTSFVSIKIKLIYFNIKIKNIKLDQIRLNFKPSQIIWQKSSTKHYNFHVKR